MLYLIVPNGDKTYKVINIINGEIYATSTTLENAKTKVKQMMGAKKHQIY